MAGLRIGMGIGIGGAAAFTPLSLFSAGEQGYWLDPSDFSTMFQDTAGATPVTAVGQSVRRWLDKSGRGNHFTQTSTSNAPILGRNPVVGTRNLLLRSEEFDNASWNKTRASVTANATTSPDGTVDADKLVEDTTASSTHGTNQVFTGTAASHTFTVYAKAGERSQIRMRLYDGTTFVNETYFNLATGAVEAGTGGTITNAGNGWYRCSVTGTLAASAGCQAQIFLAVGGSGSYTGDGTSGIFVWGVQLETGSTATAYQRVGSAFDVTESGVADAYYLAFDGTDDWLQSGTITPGTDKAQVFAGVRKLSDAARGSVLGFSTTPNASNGSFEMFAPGLDAEASYGIASRGTTQASTRGTTFTAPITNVLTGLGDISGDSAILRVNGTQANFSTADQGTGNYLAYPHYIGRRGGTSQPFNGRIYQLITRFGSNLTAAQIQQAETFVNQRTGAY